MNYKNNNVVHYTISHYDTLQHNTIQHIEIVIQNIEW